MYWLIDWDLVVMIDQRFASLDGVMIQITAETMDSLRQALRDMKDFTITCGKADQEENQELVHIQWTEDDHNFNKGWDGKRKGLWSDEERELEQTRSCSRIIELIVSQSLHLLLCYKSSLCVLGEAVCRRSSAAGWIDVVWRISEKTDQRNQFYSTQIKSENLNVTFQH